MDKYMWMNRRMYVKKSEEVERDAFGRVISGPMARIDKSNITNEFRIIVSNLPLDLKWQELKDLFRSQVRETTACIQGFAPLLPQFVERSYLIFNMHPFADYLNRVSRI
jgi:hypothetical protein